MEIKITGRNVDLTDSLKAYIHKRLDNLERLYKRIYECDVILEEEKIRQNIEIILYLKKTKIIAKESSPDIYASIDNAAENIKKQLRRLNSRLNTRRRRGVINRFMRQFRGPAAEEEMSFEPEQSGSIIKSNMFADKPLLPDEAKLELDIKGKDFLMFKNADTGEVNVLYRRTDRNYGLIEPSF
ncbi:MAG: ribosome-associated translation inhibitor RaiA [Candidatus Omnitrophota bacterium]